MDGKRMNRKELDYKAGQISSAKTLALSHFNNLTDSQISVE
jgi:hypothetical protein